MDSRKKLFMFKEASRLRPEVEEWFCTEPHALFSIAELWFKNFRDCGDDVTETLHDGCPTACVENAAFGYVNVFKSHVNVGFFNGAFLPDPHNLLEGTGKRMRHTKLRPGSEVNSQALSELIKSAYLDVKERLSG
jgi:hypothetical protein